MQLTLLKSKLHNLCVTAAELEYEGSIGLSDDLLAAAGFVEYEQVPIWNITRGTRLVTYAMLHPGEGQACVNGAAAHMAEQRERQVDKELPAAGFLQGHAEQQKADHQIGERLQRNAEHALTAHGVVNGGLAR
mgnify:CR=1 FL=1